MYYIFLLINSVFFLFVEGYIDLCGYQHFFTNTVDTFILDYLHPLS